MSFGRRAVWLGIEGGIAFKTFPGDLAEKLQYLVDTPTLRDAIARAAQNRAATVYSWDAVTAQYEELLSQLSGKLAAHQPLQIANQEER